MDLLKLLRDRSAGRVRITLAKNYNDDLESVMASIGLPRRSSDLRKISRQEAINTLAMILWRDLAYGTQLIKQEEAHQRALEFVGEYASTGVEFYNNVQLSDNTSSWSPLSESTFDRCLLVVNQDSAVCVLAEDED